MKEEGTEVRRRHIAMLTVIIRKKYFIYFVVIKIQHWREFEGEEICMKTSRWEAEQHIANLKRKENERHDREEQNM